MKDSHLLSVEWRSRAEQLRAWGAPEVARFWTLAADELDAWMEQQDGELLDLTTAARVSGYSPDQLRRYLDDGRLTDHGQRGSPQVRRGDLPRRLPPPLKKTDLRPRTPDGMPDLAAEVTGPDLVGDKLRAQGIG